MRFGNSASYVYINNRFLSNRVAQMFEQLLLIKVKFFRLISKYDCKCQQDSPLKINFKACSGVGQKLERSY